jgi:hypothetical protein
MVRPGRSDNAVIWLNCYGKKKNKLFITMVRPGRSDHVKISTFVLLKIQYEKDPFNSSV